MGDAGYMHRELRVVINDDKTHCWVRLEALGDCGPGVAGWHYKAFPPSVSTLTILQTELGDSLLWPRAEPDLPRVSRRYEGQIPQAPIPLFLSRRCDDGWAVRLTAVKSHSVSFSVYEWVADAQGVLFGRFGTEEWKRSVDEVEPVTMGIVKHDGSMSLDPSAVVHLSNPADVEAYSALIREIYRYGLQHIEAAELDDQALTWRPR